jgi:tRNA(fMet)-specific endonuclease VapC
MIAFDADVLTLIAAGDARCTQKAALIPEADQAVPIVVAEQLLRGRLNVVRQAEAGKSKVPVELAYELLQRTIADLQLFEILSYSHHAEVLMQSWRKQKIKVGTSDLRIAAICVIHSATLISRNRRDFDQVPGLVVEYW